MLEMISSRKGNANMENANEFNVVGIYEGHAIKTNYDIELKLLFTEQHINEAVQFLAGFSKHIKVICKKNDKKLILGTWSVYRLAVDRNLQTKVVLRTTYENVNLEQLNSLAVNNGEKISEIIFKVKIVD